MKEAAKKRQEKLEEAEAKQRIKAKIEADKADRRRKIEQEKAIRRGEPVPSLSSAPTAAAPAINPTAAPKPASAQHSEARLRLQTPSGNILKTFPAETTLFEVAHALQEEKGQVVASFVTNFPKKVYDDVDFGTTLQEAGMVPSSVLIVNFR